MCVEHTVHLNLHDAVNVSSNNYPKEYPTTHAYDACTRKFSSSEGIFKIKLVDTTIAFDDTIGIGFGINPSFASTVYATNSAAKMPIRNNHPKSIYVLPSILGSKMWIVFGVANNVNYAGLYQFSTINWGFLLEVSLVEETGMYFFFHYFYRFPLSKDSNT